MKSKRISGIELADRMKKGMLTKFLKDLKELRKVRSHLAKQSQ